MFHYCIFVERRLLLAAYPLGLRPRKRSLWPQQKHEERRTRQTIHDRCASDPWYGFIRGNSSFVVVVRLYSHGIVLVRLQISYVGLAFCYCNVHFTE